MPKIAARRKLTDPVVRKLRPPEHGQVFVYDEHKPLAIRITANGAMSWVLRETIDGRLIVRALGDVARTTRTAAIEALEALRVGIRKNEHPVNLRESRRAAQAEQARSAEQTLRHLLDAYVDDLIARDATRARAAADVRNLFTKWVYAFDEAAIPARDVTPEAIVEVLARPLKEKRERTAAKLRSFLRAAYARAIVARLDPRVSKKLRDFGLTTNPAAAVPHLAHTRVTGREHYPEAELRAVFRALKADTSAPGQVAWLCALLGGQRPTQLLRATLADFDEERRTLTIYDRKGKRTTPRRNVLPLVGPAFKAVKDAADAARNAGHTHLFRTADGKPMRTERIEEPVEEIDAALTKEAAESGTTRERFRLKDIRAACNSLMVELEIGKEVRDQIQSHDLGSIEARHYNRFDYRPRIEAALTLLHAKLNALTAAEGAQ